MRSRRARKKQWWICTSRRVGFVLLVVLAGFQALRFAHDAFVDGYTELGNPVKPALSTTVTRHPPRPHVRSLGLPPRGLPRLVPLVQKIDVYEGCCAELDPNVRVILSEHLSSRSPVLKRAASRAEIALRRLWQHHKTSPSPWRVTAIHVDLNSSTVDDELTLQSHWEYEITCRQSVDKSSARMTTLDGHSHGICALKAAGVYGAVAALQSTLLQLFAHSGLAAFQELYIKDAPDYPVRGLMVDCGRRFVPKDVLLQQVINGMALVRMNVLQLHLSDFCRFAVDLPAFPELNLSSPENNIMRGQYSLQDISEIMEYAKDRGILLLPEVDLPGHAGGLLPLEIRGMAFCKPDVPKFPEKGPGPEQAAKVRDDKRGTRIVLKQLLSDTARAFGPKLQWFHVGGDEAHPVKECTHKNIVELEEFIVQEILQNNLNLTAVAWEELRLKQPDEDGLRAAGGSQNTIIVPWLRGTARGMVRRGHRAIVASMRNHYLDYSYALHPASNFWYDVSAPSAPSMQAVPDWSACKSSEFVWAKHSLRSLGGDIDVRFPREIAIVWCEEFGSACAGITCQKGGWCEPRHGEPFLKGSETEDSWVKLCETKRTSLNSRDKFSCTKPTWKKHPSTFLGGLVINPSGIDEARKHCVKLGDACAGVTCIRDSAGRSCRMRSGRPGLAESIRHDSWVKHCPEEDMKIRTHLLGGMSAMWTDKYSYAYQCGAADPYWGEVTGTLPDAALMFLREFDATFGESLAGMIWPRAAVSAAALWRFDPGVNSSEVAVWTTWLADLLLAGGVASCPPGCTCTELTTCSRPYSLPTWMSHSSRSNLQECFQEAERNVLGNLMKLREDTYPNKMTVDDAQLLCFWFGKRCAGISCTVSAVQGSQTGCRVHGPSCSSGCENEQDPNGTIFLSKNSTNHWCQPSLSRTRTKWTPPYS